MTSLFWFLGGVGFFLLELTVPGFVLFFFGVGAWVVALCVMLFDLTLNSQILLFTVSSLVSLVLLRRFVKKSFTGTRTGEEDAVHAEAGTRVEVVVDIIPPAEGKIKYSGTTWRAVAEEKIVAGEFAEIVVQEGLVMKVRTIATPDNE